MTTRPRTLALNPLFLGVVEALVTFTRGPDGRATSLTLHQNGASTPDPRVK